MLSFRPERLLSQDMKQGAAELWCISKLASPPLQVSSIDCCFNSYSKFEVLHLLVLCLANVGPP